MAVVCVLLGSVVGLAGTAMAWALGADFGLALLGSFLLGYILTGVLLCLAVRLARNPNEDLEYELLALRENQLRHALDRKEARPADPSVLFRALRLQERTALRGGSPPTSVFAHPAE